MKSITKYCIISIILIGFSCDSSVHQKRSQDESCNDIHFENPKVEREHFFMMMAYAVVFKDWQYIEDVNTVHGYNIGSIIVDESNFVISWGRNEKFIRKNRTQHGEVRSIQSYLEKSEDWFLEDCTIYTTLEPCVMCAGLMVMSREDRVVYGPSDPSYGNAMEWMQFTSRNSIEDDTTKAYPRNLIYEKSRDKISLDLDSAFLKQRSKSRTDLLTSDAAEHYLEQATQIFLNHKVQFEENILFLDSARHIFEGIPV